MKILIIGPTTHTIVNFRGDMIQDMAAMGHEIAAVGPEKGYEKDIERLGGRFILLPMEKTSTDVFHDMKYMKKLLGIIKAEKPDIVFSYTIKPVIYGSVAAKLAGVKSRYSMITGLGYVFTTRTLRTRFLRFIAGVLYRMGLLCSDRVFFQNEDDLYEFTRAGYVSAKKCILVNGSGVNMDKFPKKPLPKKMSFLMIARVMKNKGIMEYLRAARKVKLKYPTVTFSLVGPIERIQDSLKYEEIEPYIEDGSIEYFGETKDVRPYLENCSVFVLPSYREGTPRTILEAMATGRPVITTDVPGCRQTVIDGINGFLVPAGESDVLAEIMEWFIQNPAEIKKMGEQSYSFCREKYDVKKVNEKILQAMGLTGTIRLD